MAPLPPLPQDLPSRVAAAIEHMAAARAHADGRAELGDVYRRMFHNPALAERVGALGEQIRFHGVLPDDVREVVILRYSAQLGYGYEVAHHRRPAHQAGLNATQIESLANGAVPVGLRPDQAAAVAATDAVCAGRSIPHEVQDVIVAAYGTAGAVELVIVCGLYAIMGYTVTSFDIGVEPEIARLPDP